MIGGEWRVVDAMPVGIDLSKLVADHQQAAKTFR
jgi:hypothetical protein